MARAVAAAVPFLLGVLLLFTGEAAALGGRKATLTDAHLKWFQHGGSRSASLAFDRPEESLPLKVVDWGLAGETPEARGRKLVSALQETGFAYLGNHGVDARVIQAAWNHAKGFFEKAKEQPSAFANISQAPERKELEDAPLKTQRGFGELYGEALNPYLGQDRKMSFDYGLAIESTRPGDEADRTHIGTNRWPREGEEARRDEEDKKGLDHSAVVPQVAPGFREASISYLKEVYALSQELLKGLALGLGLEEEALEKSFEKPLVVNRFLLYPSSQNNSAASDHHAAAGAGGTAARDSLSPPPSMGTGSHVDYGALTLIWQEAPGLEVLEDLDRHRAAGRSNSSSSGEEERWRRVDPAQGAFVVGTGYVLEKLSNGRLPATRHRVVNRASEDRMSFALFLDPNPQAWISPLLDPPTNGAAESPNRFEAGMIAGHKGVIFEEDDKGGGAEAQCGASILCSREREEKDEEGEANIVAFF